MRSVLISLTITMTFTGLSCGDAKESKSSPSSQGLDQTAENRYDTPEAKSCRSKNHFWDIFKETCWEDYAIAEFACSFSELEKRVSDDELSKVKQRATEGYKPTACGEKKGDSGFYVYIVNWEKEEGDKTFFSTRSYIGKKYHSPEAEKQVAAAKKLNVDLVGTWSMCYPWYGTVKETTITVTKTTLEQVTISYAESKCEDKATKLYSLIDRGTWQLVADEGSATDDDPGALKILNLRNYKMYHDVGSADSANLASDCGKTTWAANQELDVTGVDEIRCGSKFEPEFYEFFAMKDGALKLSGATLGAVKWSSTYWRSNTDLQYEFSK